MRCLKVQVQGIVQGVGFRPYVYNLALKLNLKGYINNDDKGVNILLVGNDNDINKLLRQLKINPPVLSKIDNIYKEELPLSKNSYDSFEIIQSKSTTSKTTMISPDIAICDDCENEMNTNSDCRYNYPLINCTNCGPRYSIINTIPYDRQFTSMSKFEMCESCKNEYQNPTNRRYHAQPISCQNCGPIISLYNNKNKLLSNNTKAIQDISQLINNGSIVAVKGLGGFHLICDANNDKVVQKLRTRKNRPTKPFAVMFENITEIKKVTRISKIEEEIITSKEKPITLVSKDKNYNLSEYVAPNINRLGVFIAYTPLHKILFKNLNNPIIASSANLSDEPIIINKDELLNKLSNVVDYVLDINRDIIHACDDSVVQVVNNKNFMLRLSRGYAPKVLKLPFKTDKKILALGANQKNTISLAFDDNLILSPHIGDLNSLTSLEYFTRTVNTFKRFYNFEPDIIVCDKHPIYETTKWAKSQQSSNNEIIQVQHHYAHVLSCMAEYKLQDDVLAFSWDGTGYGDDGNIWGGEVFIANTKKYERINHFKYFKLLGGEKAVREPKRVGLSLLFENFTLEEVFRMDNSCVTSFTQKEIQTMYLMWQKGLNAPLTSSVGRIFDAISSLGDFSQTLGYEGESGLLIENEYDENIKESYSYEINEQIDISKLVSEVILEKNKKIVATKFLNTLCEIIIDISKLYPKLPIVLTGGVFQNKTLTQNVYKKLEEINRKVYIQYDTPLNDGGLSIGQIYYCINN
jgi:hydrogenase maturation protein HypF